MDKECISDEETSDSVIGPLLERIVAKYPPLSEDEERELCTSKPEDTWRREIVLHNIRFAQYYADRYMFTPWGETEEDRFTRALEGMVQAAQTFDPAKNVRFCTWSVYFIIKSFRDVSQKFPAGKLLARTVSSIDQTFTCGGHHDREQEIGALVGGSIAVDEPEAWTSHYEKEFSRREEKRVIDFVCSMVLNDLMAKPWARKDSLRFSAKCFKMACLGVPMVEISRKMGVVFEDVRYRVAMMRKHLIKMCHAQDDRVREVSGFIRRSATYTRWLASAGKRLARAS